jgi:hypothetical protein
MQVEIKRLDVWSLVKISFLIYAVLGIIVGVIYIFFALLLGGLVGYNEALDGGLFRIAATGVGVLLVPLLALFYGLIGAIGAAILAVVYNVLSRTIGGVKLTLQADSATGEVGTSRLQTDVRL